MFVLTKSMPVTLVLSSCIAVAACIAPTDELESTTAALGTHENAVTKWNQIAATTLAAFPGPAGGAAPSVQIHLAMVQGAVYDAVNAITPRHHRPYLLHRRFSARASGDAAVATATYLVLSNIISTVPPQIGFANRQALQDGLDTQYEEALAAIPDCSKKQRGIEAGTAAAEAMIAARENDGRFGPSQWVPSSAAGHWNPTTPTGAVMNDPTPWIGGVEPFLMASPSQFRSAGPNALTSDAYTQDFLEVKRLGGNGDPPPTGTHSDRTPVQTHIALWWQSAGGPSLMWSGAARRLADDPARSLDLAETARLLAMMNLSGADAAINCWNDKYHFDFWRPFQAIRRADEDGNPATLPLPTGEPPWTPLISAPYPEHASGHLCIDGAHSRVLEMFFGTDEIPIDITSSVQSETRSFDRISDAVDEIVEARIWAGLHFRTADIQGRGIGISVANFMADNYFQPVGKHCDH